MLKEINLLDIIKRELIGKKIKILTNWYRINQPYSVYKKKSNNVTDKQFESGEPKYRMLVNRHKVVGKHEKYEVFTITDVKIEHYDSDIYDSYDRILLVLNNGEREIDFDVSTKLVAIDNETYLYEQI